jgi:hypothetical protein
MQQNVACVSAATHVCMQIGWQMLVDCLVSARAFANDGVPHLILNKSFFSLRSRAGKHNIINNLRHLFRTRGISHSHHSLACFRGCYMEALRCEGHAARPNGWFKARVRENIGSA